MIKGFRTTPTLAKARLFEPEQAAYWVMMLNIENKRRKDNLSFRASRTGYQDVYFNPLYVVTVSVPFAPDRERNQYVEAILENGDKSHA